MGLCLQWLVREEPEVVGMPWAVFMKEDASSVNNGRTVEMNATITDS